MLKHVISYLLSLIFVLLIAAPTTIMLIEKSYDVSVFFSFNEEENPQESVNNIDVNLVETDYMEIVLEPQTKTLFDIYSESYANFSLDNISPPPELF
tara:strand:- start:68490 stop:68780 length:291 start_codon:yes stop_codon:yes gene_type:complete